MVSTGGKLAQKHLYVYNWETASFCVSCYKHCLQLRMYVRTFTVTCVGGSTVLPILLNHLMACVCALRNIEWHMHAITKCSKRAILESAVALLVFQVSRKHPSHVINIF